MDEKKIKELIGKKATYWDYTGIIEEVWNLKDFPMTLVKIKCGDSFLTVNVDIVNIITEQLSGDSKVATNG